MEAWGPWERREEVWIGEEGEERGTARGRAARVRGSWVGRLEANRRLAVTVRSIEEKLWRESRFSRVPHHSNGLARSTGDLKMCTLSLAHSRCYTSLPEQWQRSSYRVRHPLFLILLSSTSSSRLDVEEDLRRKSHSSVHGVEGKEKE